jgi:hypothetical protein
MEMMPSNNKKRRKDAEMNHDYEAKNKLGRNENVVPPKDIIHTAWEHYRSYLESVEEPDEAGCDDQQQIQPDVDELYEIIDLLGQYVHKQTSDTSLQFLLKSSACSCGGENNNSLFLSSSCSSSYLSNIESLLPVLLSMVYLHLGDHAISKGFDEHIEQEGKDAQQQQSNHVEDCLHKSLSYFPLNAAALSMLANYQRMNMTASLEDICCAYDIAAKNARIVRDKSIAILAQEQDDGGDGHDTEEGDEEAMLLVKEWVELLLLDGITGSEYVGEDNSEEEKDKDICDDDDDDGENLDGDFETDNAQEDDEFSMSMVEATCSFMAALIHSTLKQHDEALCHLSKFDLTHRIHPNVWRAGSTTDKLLSSARK